MMLVELPRRPFGRTGLSVAPLGLAGSYGIDADATERAFHELSINYFFVTPRMKGLFEGVRRLIKAGHRDEIVLATGPFFPTGRALRGQWDDVARGLGTDRIDVLQVFWVRWRWYLTGGTIETLRRFKEEGKIRAFGISTHERRMAPDFASEFGLDMLMLRYNAAHRGAEQDVFARLPAERPAVVAYTATRWGRLLRPVGDKPALTASECYRFQLSHPAVDVVLTGPKTWDELRANAEGAALGPLPAERLAEVRAFGDAVHASATSRFGFGRR
ncbi:MAG: aldo/keto reductase [Deltaproteobacteria bacterium]|nr:aldo/keto reductase [Deltaproteobacteria bacterium]